MLDRIKHFGFKFDFVNLDTFYVINYFIRVYFGSKLNFSYQRYLQQNQIRALHKPYGICLTGSIISVLNLVN